MHLKGRKARVEVNEGEKVRPYTYNKSVQLRRYRLRNNINNCGCGLLWLLLWCGY
jgi:hypothetical protein